MKVHKRTKNSRIRGSKTAGWGFRQKHKGHGNKGGVGMAGTGKKGDHMKQRAAMDAKKGKYFGKQGKTSRGTEKAKYEKINLCDIKANFFKKDGDKIDFSKHKILGHGDGFKAEIKALAATASAISKMEAAGGKIILPEVKAPVKQYAPTPKDKGVPSEGKKEVKAKEASEDKGE